MLLECRICGRLIPFERTKELEYNVDATVNGRRMSCVIKKTVEDSYIVARDKPPEISEPKISFEIICKNKDGEIRLDDINKLNNIIWNSGSYRVKMSGYCEKCKEYTHSEHTGVI
ncbi:MAG: hypothetical protein ACP5QH_06005 [Thermoplasmata archaeon]|jgi:hypothetical protein